MPILPEDFDASPPRRAAPGRPKIAAGKRSPNKQDRAQQERMISFPAGQITETRTPRAIPWAIAAAVIALLLFVWGRPLAKLVTDMLSKPAPATVTPIQDPRGARPLELPAKRTQTQETAPVDLLPRNHTPPKPPAGSAVSEPQVSPQDHRHQVAPPPPQPLPIEGFMQNARTALAEGNLISPENNNALYWVRRAKEINPHDTAAIQIEQMILAHGILIVQREQKAKNYAGALALLAPLESLYPNNSDLRKLRTSIWDEQQSQKTPSH